MAAVRLLKPEVVFRLYDRHLEKSIWHHNFAADSPIMIKFDRLMQNDLPTTINRSKSKLEAQFQHGGRPFSETGSSLILAVDWDISSQFGKQMDIHLLKRLPSWNLNPEVDIRFYGRHLEKSIWRHNSAANRRIATKFGRWMVKGKNRNRKYNSNMAAFYFFETGSSFISAVHWDISSKFGIQIVIHFFKQGVITKPEPGSRFLTLWPSFCKIDMAS